MTRTSKRRQAGHMDFSVFYWLLLFIGLCLIGIGGTAVWFSVGALFTR